METVAVNQTLGGLTDAGRVRGMPGGQDPHQLSLAVSDIESVIPAGAAFILVDDDALPRDGFSERPVLRFGGCGAGSPEPPAADQAAVQELERRRGLGRTHLVFAWTAFSFLERHAGLERYLRSHFHCLFRDDRILAFGLQRYSKEALFHACASPGSSDPIHHLPRAPCVSA